MGEALATRLSKPVPSPTRLAESYDHLGMIDLREGKPAVAREEALHALRLRQAFYPEDNDALAESYNHLGQVELAEGHPVQAEEHFRHAGAICERLFAADPHPLKVEALAGLGQSLVLRKRLVEGKALLAEASGMQRALGVTERTGNSGIPASL